MKGERSSQAIAAFNQVFARHIEDCEAQLTEDSFPQCTSLSRVDRGSTLLVQFLRRDLAINRKPR